MPTSNVSWAPPIARQVSFTPIGELGAATVRWMVHAVDLEPKSCEADICWIASENPQVEFRADYAKICNNLVAKRLAYTSSHQRKKARVHGGNCESIAKNMQNSWVGFHCVSVFHP